MTLTITELANPDFPRKRFEIGTLHNGCRFECDVLCSESELTTFDTVLEAIDAINAFRTWLRNAGTERDWPNAAVLDTVTRTIVWDGQL